MVIKSYSLHTSEVDDADAACAEITAQLQKISLLNNTVGIVACHYDYLHSGAYARLAELLPFALVGFTTFYQTEPGAAGLFELSVTVLTSDDVRFAVGSSLSEFDKSPRERIFSAYEAAHSVHGEKPALILSFLSMNRPVSGDEFLRLLDEASGHAPCFGGVATGDSDSGESTFLLAGSRFVDEGFAILLLIGELRADFFFGSHDKDKLMETSARVTGAKGCVLKTLDNRPAVDFLRKNGLDLSEANQMGLITLPFLEKRMDEDFFIPRPMLRPLEDGSILFMGEVREGSTFRIGGASTEDMLQVANTVMAKAVAEHPKPAVLFMFSCIGRYILLGMDTTAEMDGAKALLPKNSVYLGSYVAGELCPIPSAGKQINRYHNSSFVVCALS